MLEAKKTWWEKVVEWIAVLGSAHVVDDGSAQDKESPKKPDRPKLRFVPRHN